MVNIVQSSANIPTSDLVKEGDGVGKGVSRSLYKVAGSL